LLTGFSQNGQARETRLGISTADAVECREAHASAFNQAKLLLEG